MAWHIPRRHFARSGPAAGRFFAAIADSRKNWEAGPVRKSLRRLHAATCFFLIAWAPLCLLITLAMILMRASAGKWLAAMAAFMGLWTILGVLAWRWSLKAVHGALMREEDARKAAWPDGAGDDPFSQGGAAFRFRFGPSPLADARIDSDDAPPDAQWTEAVVVDADAEDAEDGPPPSAGDGII